ncbi:MAG TPA: hypothetical protein VGO62_22320 [Myxococcota bacterium]
MRTLLVAFVALCALSCSKPETPEAQIQKLLDRGAKALEDKDAAAAADTLSDRYGDNAHHNKQQLKQLAFFALQQGPLLVSFQTVDIHVDGAHATAKLAVLAVQGSATIVSPKDLLPSNARAYNLSLRLEKDGKDWKIDAIDGLGGLTPE